MEAFARARKSASGDEDAPGRFAADYGLWVGSYVRGDLPSMRTHAGAFLAGVAARPDSPEAGVAHRVLGTTHCFAGEYAEAREHLERALTLFQPGRDDDLAFRFGQDAGVAAMCYLAIATWPLGNVRRAVSLIDAARERLASMAHIGTHPYAKLHAAMFELMRGDRARAAENGSEAARLACEHDLPLWRAYGAFFEGLATAERGALGEGLSDMRRCAERLRQQDLVNFDWLLKIALAEAEARAGDPDRGLAVLDEALATSNRIGFRAFEAELHRARGDILLKRDLLPIGRPSGGGPRGPRPGARRLCADARDAGDRRGAGAARTNGERRRGQEFERQARLTPLSTQAVPCRPSWAGGNFCFAAIWSEYLGYFVPRASFRVKTQSRDCAGDRSGIAAVTTLCTTALRKRVFATSRPPWG
jgi:tetratricopeptide (TPR) repeat protein